MLPSPKKLFLVHWKLQKLDINEFKKKFFKNKLNVYIMIYYIILALISCHLYYISMMAPVNPKTEVVDVYVLIKKGDTVEEVAKKLKSSGLIQSVNFMKIYSKLKNYDKKIQAGKYKFNNRMGLEQILNDLKKGNTVNETIRFTIPEGFTLEEIAEELSKKGLVNKSDFLEAAKAGKFDYDFLKTLEKQTSLEGYLFPDTYEVFLSSSEKDIIEKMLDRFDYIFKDTFIKRANELGLTVHEVVILASIIEKEAKLSDERPVIASVFLNRLNKGMKLQSCATVQYALGERKEVLLIKDLEIDSPYNTYKYSGLPPGPISNPGLDSIKAVLYPAKTDYLFFSAKGDGSHYFGRTYSEHLHNINKNR